MALECWRWFWCWCLPARAAAPAPPTAPPDPRAEFAAQAAMRLIEDAQALPAQALQVVRRLLEAGDAASAARALMAIRALLGQGAHGCVGAAERATRVVVVLRCCDPREVGHEAFIVAAEAAFGRRFRGGFLNDEDRELRAVLLLAYHKLR